MAPLVAQFQQHRAELDELQRMVDEDHLTTIRVRDGQIAWLVVLQGTQPVRKEPAEFPEARRRAYLDLMKRAGLPYGLDHGDFLAASQGSHRKALHVGFTRCPEQGDFVASLDDAGGFSSPRAFYRRLEAGWCLVLKGGD